LQSLLAVMCYGLDLFRNKGKLLVVLTHKIVDKMILKLMIY
jgi:hypothetical protein